jgi:hypothetical protein
MMGAILIAGIPVFVLGVKEERGRGAAARAV